MKDARQLEIERRTQETLTAQVIAIAVRHMLMKQFPRVYAVVVPPPSFNLGYFDYNGGGGG